MKTLFLMTFITFLSGCSLFRPKLEPPLVVQTQYVIKLPPAQLLTLPAPVAPINVDTAKQSDVAAWIIQKEMYTKTIENDLKGIAQFFTDQQTALNQK